MSDIVERIEAGPDVSDIPEWNHPDLDEAALSGWAVLAKEAKVEIEKLRAQIPDRASLVDVVMAATDLNDHADDYGVPWSRELDAAITKVRETIT